MTKQWLEMVKYSGLGDTETFEATYDICRAVLERGVPGDFVECGVYAGAQAAIMAKAILDRHEILAAPSHIHFGNYTRVHLFDSFAGIPAPGAHDPELAQNVGGESAVSLEDVKANMKRWGIPDELLVYHVGLFEDTVELWIQTRQYANEVNYPRRVPDIAVLRLDGDLYESTKVCMEHLEPLVSRGGWIIVDDFNLSGCRKAVMEHSIPAPVYWRKPTK